MNQQHFFCAGSTPALTYAVEALKQAPIPFCREPSPLVTHLLLPVPSMDPDGIIKGGVPLQPILDALPQNVTVIGGNLNSTLFPGRRVVDLLQDPDYTAKNASITACCAVKLAMNLLPCTLEGCPTLVIGWGRIGKCLCRFLKGLGAEITVAARKPSDRAMLRALGYQAIETASLTAEGYRLILNTVPAPVMLPNKVNAIKIDLASTLGLGGSDVIWARGLPGKDAPESSGRLIAETVLNIINKE